MTGRNIDSDLLDELQAVASRPIFLCEFFFDTAPLRFWSGIGNLTWNGNVFTGSGNLLGFSEIEETQETEAPGMTFTLSGLPLNILSLAYNEMYSGRSCTLYIAAVDENDVLVGDPYPAFSGFMDVMEIAESGTTCDITLSVENELIELEKVKVFRYTPEDQKRKYPDDTAFDNVPSLQDKEITWGRVASTSS